MGAVCSDQNSRPNPVALMYRSDYSRLDEPHAENSHLEQSIPTTYFRHRDSKLSISRRVRRSPVLYNCENDETVFSIPKRFSPRSFAGKKAVPRSQRLSSCESCQDLDDCEKKKMVKKILEPILINNVRRIVNDSVEELFKNIASSSNLISDCQSEAAKHRGQVNDSSPTNHTVNSLEMQNSKVSSNLSTIKVKSEDSIEIPSWKLAWNQGENLKFFSDQSSCTSDLTPRVIGSTNEFSIWGPPSCRREANMGVSMIKLGKFPSARRPDLDQTSVGQNPSKLMSRDERCLGVNDTGAELVRNEQLMLTDEKSITKLAGDAKICFGESIQFENQHVSKILTPVPAAGIPQIIRNKTGKTISSVKTEAKIKGY